MTTALRPIHVRVVINNLSDDERWMSTTAIHHNSGEHVLCDLETQTLEVLAELGRSCKKAVSPLPPHHPITVKISDGLDLHGYLSLPSGELPGRAHGRV